MGFKLDSLWKPPELNPVTLKAQSIPLLNPFNVYGRVFHFAWLGYFFCFWAWYAFQPLLTKTLRADLRLSQADVANSNVISLVATLLARLTAGTACDWIGPRWTMVALLSAGAIPIALAGTVTTANGLIVLRFFVGMIGACFVPTVVWTAGFFDKNVVGTACALTAGFGTGGIGVTYFVMPAVFDSLVQHQKIAPHVAWRVAFIVPFILILAIILGTIFLCPDTPTGKWSSRHLAHQRRTDTRDAFFSTVRDRKLPASTGSHDDNINLKSAQSTQHHEDPDYEAQIDEFDLVNAASWELVKKPTIHDSAQAIFSFPTLALAVALFCTFGPELSINSFLGAYYAQSFPSLGQTGSGNWAAMYGLLNFVFRPLGGIISDAFYRWTRSLWAKKILITAFGILLGINMILIGVTDQHDKGSRIGLVTLLAFATEAGSGAIFSLTPHVHPTSTGLITGLIASMADLGGIVYLLVARYNGTNYAKVFWILGAANMAGHLAVAWIRPIPKNQLGGR